MNPRELDVLNILWKSEEPMMATDIVNAGEGLTQSTVTAVLRKLLHANLVEVVGVTHSGKVLSRTYRPAKESKELLMKYFLEQYSMFKDVIKPAEMCAEIKKLKQCILKIEYWRLEQYDNFIAEETER